MKIAPVAPGERMFALDVLRGVALFGVLWVNTLDYWPTDPATSLDNGLLWFEGFFVEGRFVTLLCLLFGIGFGIQLARANDRAVEIRTFYLRRSLILLMIGVVHGMLLWRGDILTLYGMVAIAMMLFRKASPRVVLLAAASLWFGARIVLSFVPFLGKLTFLPPVAFRSEEINDYAQGSWSQVEHFRVTDYLTKLQVGGLWLYASTLALFLVGFWAVQSGYLQRVIADPKATRRLLLIAAIVAAIGYAADAYAGDLWPTPKFSTPLWYLRIFLLRFVSWATVGGAVAYAAVGLLFVQSPAAARWCRPVAATGRMALTTYLVQSVICTLLFYGYGLGWYGSLSYTVLFLLTLVIFASQIVFSSWWLSRYHFGPVEWVWRTLAYGSRPHMRRVLATAEAVAT